MEGRKNGCRKNRNNGVTFEGQGQDYRRKLSNEFFGLRVDASADLRSVYGSRVTNCASRQPSLNFKVLRSRGYGNESEGSM